MKYKITINDNTYKVEIEDINARPVIARVDGERFEVTPEHANQTEVAHMGLRQEDASGIQNRVEKKFETANQSVVAQSPNPALNGNALTAPLPGTVVEVFVKTGEKVEAGQVVLIIEAMKMKNSIRSTYSGTIKEVLINTGQSVAHKQALIKFGNAEEAA